MGAPGDLLRLSALQASWNRRGMQELGWLSVAQAHLGHLEDKSWRLRWLGFRNSNPYLAGLVLGAGIRAERDGDSQRVPTLLDALSRQLGAVGDALIWTGIRPALAFAGTTAALFWSPVAVAIVWALFAAGVAVGLRFWCLRRGLEGADSVLDWVERGGVHRAIALSRGLAALFALSAALAVLLRVDSAWWGVALALVVGSVCAWRRWPIELCLLGLIGLFWVFPFG